MESSAISGKQTCNGRISNSTANRTIDFKGDSRPVTGKSSSAAMNPGKGLFVTLRGGKAIGS